MTYSEQVQQLYRMAKAQDTHYDVRQAWAEMNYDHESE